MASHASLTVDELKDIQVGPVYVLILSPSRFIQLTGTSCTLLHLRAGVPTRNKGFLFFGIKKADEFRERFGRHIFHHITSSFDARKVHEEVQTAKAAKRMATITVLNVAFSQQGLTQLSLVDDIKDLAFQQGQLARAASLGDQKKNWLEAFTRNAIHGLFEVTGFPEEQVRKYIQEIIKNQLGDSIEVIFEHYGEMRPGNQKDHEHCESP
jgi:hypothetical protein